MPILIYQQSRLVEVGQIRIGIKKAGKSKSFPARLETFRFSSRLPHLLEKLAAKYGGKVRPFQTMDKDCNVEIRTGEYEVISSTNQIRALFSIQLLPSGDRESLEQWFTHRDRANGKQMRKCDGITCTTWVDGKRVGVPCMCEETHRLCTIQSRVKVFLPHAPDVGTWSFVTNSTTFSSEILGMIRAAEAMAEPGCFLLPVFLTLTSRHKENAPGQQNGTFPVVLVSFDPDPDYVVANMIGSVQRRILLPSTIAELPSSLPELPEPSVVEAAVIPPAPIPDNELKALEYLSSIEHLIVDDFKTWCEENSVNWITAALKAQKQPEITHADQFFGFLYEVLEGAGR